MARPKGKLKVQALRDLSPEEQLSAIAFGTRYTSQAHDFVCLLRDAITGKKTLSVAQERSDLRKQERALDRSLERLKRDSSRDGRRLYALARSLLAGTRQTIARLPRPAPRYRPKAQCLQILLVQFQACWQKKDGSFFRQVANAIEEMPRDGVASHQRDPLWVLRVLLTLGQVTRNVPTQSELLWVLKLRGTPVTRTQLKRYLKYLGCHAGRAPAGRPSHSMG